MTPSFPLCQGAVLQLWSQRAPLAGPCPAGECPLPISTAVQSRADVWDESRTCGPSHTPLGQVPKLSAETADRWSSLSLLCPTQSSFQRAETHFAGGWLEKACKASSLSSYKIPHCGRQADSRSNIHPCVGTSEEILNCGESGAGQRPAFFCLIVMEGSPLQKMKEM